MRAWIERMQFRWQECRDPFDCEIDVRAYPTVILYTLPDDIEPVAVLRRLRALLFGYGPAWTFWQAGGEWLLEKPWWVYTLILLIVIWVVGR